MTRPFEDPEDSSERVNDVLGRAGALSDELRRTITELTQLLRDENEGVKRARESTN